MFFHFFTKGQKKNIRNTFELKLKTGLFINVFSDPVKGRDQCYASLHYYQLKKNCRTVALQS